MMKEEFQRSLNGMDSLFRIQLEEFDHENPIEATKILGEIKQGFEIFGNIEPLVSFFGSARLPKEHEYYRLTQELAHSLSKKGISIFTGAGPSLMEAANRGAKDPGGKGQSLGANIIVPAEQETNSFIDVSMTFESYIARRLMFLRFSNGFIFTPGGFGTLDELSEVLVMMANYRIPENPIVLYQTKFWNPFYRWLKEDWIQEGTISPASLSKICMTDSIEEVFSHLANNPKLNIP